MKIDIYKVFNTVILVACLALLYNISMSVKRMSENGRFIHAGENDIIDTRTGEVYGNFIEGIDSSTMSKFANQNQMKLTKPIIGR